MSQVEEATVFENTRLAGLDPVARDVWLSRLRTLRAAMAAWDLRVARSLAPRFMNRMLARLLPDDVVAKAAVDERRWTFRQVLPRAGRDAIVDRIDRLTAAFRSATGTGSDDLCVLEEELTLQATRRNRSRETAREARALLMQRLLMTHEDKLAIVYYCTDPCAAPESSFRTKGEQTRRYPVDRINLVRAGVDVSFTHHYTTLSGDRLKRAVNLRFVPPPDARMLTGYLSALELCTNDGSRHRLLLAQPGVDYNPNTLSARAALSLARAWRDYDTPESYGHLTAARFPNKVDWDPEAESESSSSDNDEEEGPATDKSFSFGSQEAHTVPAAAVTQQHPMVKVKMEMDLEFDADTTLTDLLQRLPAPPAPTTTRRRIIIDLTDD